MNPCSEIAGKQNADLAGDISMLVVVVSILHCVISILFFNLVIFFSRSHSLFLLSFSLCPYLSRL